MRKSMLDRAREAHAGNLDAAAAILQRPEVYGGEGAGVVLWARRYLEQHGAPMGKPAGGNLAAGRRGLFTEPPRHGVG